MSWSNICRDQNVARITMYDDPVPLALEGNELLAVLLKYCRENLTGGSQMALGHVRSLGFSSLREDISETKEIDRSRCSGSEEESCSSEGQRASSCVAHGWMA